MQTQQKMDENRGFAFLDWDADDGARDLRKIMEALQVTREALLLACEALNPTDNANYIGSFAEHFRRKAYGRLHGGESGETGNLDNADNSPAGDTG